MTSKYSGSDHCIVAKGEYQKKLTLFSKFICCRSIIMCLSVRKCLRIIHCTFFIIYMIGYSMYCSVMADFNNKSESKSYWNFLLFLKMSLEYKILNFNPIKGVICYHVPLKVICVYERMVYFEILSEIKNDLIRKHFRCFLIFALPLPTIQHIWCRWLWNHSGRTTESI